MRGSACIFLVDTLSGSLRLLLVQPAVVAPISGRTITEPASAVVDTTQSLQSLLGTKPLAIGALGLYPGQCAVEPPTLAFD